MEIEGDYSDVLSYLANLFSIKKVRSIEIDRYGITYNSCKLITNVSSGSAITISEIPERDALDRVKSIELTVSGIEEGTVSVYVGWDSVSSESDIRIENLHTFLEILDKSTFRYF